jgi:hypothetical protein
MQPGIDPTGVLGSEASQAAAGNLSAATNAAAAQDNISSDTSFSSMSALQSKAPQIYNQFMQLFAWQMCNDDQQWNNDYITEIQEERAEEEEQ